MPRTSTTLTSRNTGLLTQLGPADRQTLLELADALEQQIAGLGVNGALDLLRSIGLLIEERLNPNNARLAMAARHAGMLTWPGEEA